MRQLRRLAWLPALLLGSTGQVLGQAADADSATLYRVELIVFANLDGNPGEEDFHHDSQLPTDRPLPRRLRLPALELERLFDPELPVDAASPFGQEAVSAATPAEPEPDPATPPPGDRLELFAIESPATASAPPLPAGFRVLDPAELELGDVRRRLANSRDYRVLAHRGWDQLGYDADRSVPLDLAQLGITNPTGTLELYVGRYFHVLLDVRYANGSGTLWSVPPGTTGLVPLVYADTYRLQTERHRMIRDDINAFDHPMFGIILKITAAPEPEEIPAGQRGPAG